MKLFKLFLCYALFTAGFYFLLAVIPQYILQKYYIQIAQAIVSFATNPVFNIRFNYIGFFIPAILAIVIPIIILERYKQTRMNKKVAVLFMLSFAVVGLISNYFNFVKTGINGSSLDAPLILFTMLLFSILLYLNEYKTAFLFSYTFGFLCGFISDILGTGAFKVGVYGGFGFFDGDFVLPIAFLLTTYLFYKYKSLFLGQQRG